MYEPEEVPCCPSCYKARGESVGMTWDGETEEFFCPTHDRPTRVRLTADELMALGQLSGYSKSDAARMILDSGKK